MNVVSCYPHGKPEKGAIDACRQNLKDQLDAAGTEWVLVCGAVALETLLPHSNRHSRGVVIPAHGKKLFGILHPSFILRAKSSRIYKEWQDSLWMFKMLIEDALPGLLNTSSCIYCGSMDLVSESTPVCKDHMKYWRIDIKWRYMPPEQMELL